MTMQFPVLLARVSVTTANRRLVFTEDGGGNLNADVAVGDYYLSGDGTASDLCAALVVALEAAGAGEYTVNYNAKITPEGVTGEVVIALAGGSPAVFVLAWDNGSTTLPKAWFGFSATTASGDSATSTLSPSVSWCSDQPTATISPTSETARGGILQHDTPSGATHTVVLAEDVEMRDLRFVLVAKDRTWRQHATSDVQRAFQSFRRIFRDGRPVQLHHCAILSGTTLEIADSGTLIGTYVVAQSGLDVFAPTLSSPTAALLFDWTLPLRGYVS